MTEKWKTITAAPAYQVSSLGRVRRITTGRILQPYRRGRATIAGTSRHRPDPYLRVDIRGLQGRLQPSVHLLVLEAFVGPRPEDHHGDHVDTDVTNNRLSNLRWLPALENTTRRYQEVSA